MGVERQRRCFSRFCLSSSRFYRRIITLEHLFLACSKDIEIPSQFDFLELILELTAKSRGSALSDLKKDKNKGRNLAEYPIYRWTLYFSDLQEDRVSGLRSRVKGLVKRV